jgi:sugar O-acyltransferase (sialic acid O-acetyltransferase NeuD family)
MGKKVIIIGASGHGKVVADIIIKSGNEIAGFLDDSKTIGEDFCGYPILGKSSDYYKYKNDCEFVIAIGNADVREKISNDYKDVKWHTPIHPKSVISSIDVSIGEGTVVMANAVINSGAKIGNHCIVNTGSIVEHDNIIGDFVHVSVGSKLAGNVHVGRKTWIGIGATVKNNIEICDNCMIGAGAVVVKDIKEEGTYIGIPAKKLIKKMD